MHLDQMYFMMVVISFWLDGCNMYVMVSFTLQHLYHGLDKDEVFYLKNVYQHCVFIIPSCGCGWCLDLVVVNLRRDSTSWDP